MTRNEFYRWTRQHGCRQEQLRDHTTGRAIKIINPARAGCHAYLQTPLDDRQIYPETVIAACVQLAIPVPPARLLEQ